MSEPGPPPSSSPPVDPGTDEDDRPRLLPGGARPASASSLARSRDADDDRPRLRRSDPAASGATTATPVSPAKPAAAIPADAPGPVAPAAAAAGTAGTTAPRASAAPPAGATDPMAVLTDLVPVPPPTGSGRAGGAGSGRRHDSGFWRFGFPALVVLCMLLIPLLAYAGRKTVLQSTDGKVLSDVVDPTQPGWQAIAEPTPTMLVVNTDAEGVANGLTVLSLTGDGAGGVVFVPITTVLDLPDLGQLPLNAVADKGGLTALRTSVEGILGAGTGDVQVLGPKEWADLVAPLGTITVDNPDPVTQVQADGTETVVFPKGSVTLTPDQVERYLGTANPGETDVNRLIRHKAFWSAWLRQVGASKDPGVVPGERESGLGKFVRTLAADRVEYETLPVQQAGIPGSAALVYFPVADQVQAMVARLIPFPVAAPPGSRMRVRLLDGTGKLDHGLPVAPLLVAAGGQITQIGNASAFGVPRTRIEYYDEARRPDAEKLRDALGGGDVVKGSEQTGAVDVTITLGDDQAQRPLPSLPPVTAAPVQGATTTVVGVAGGE